MEELADITKNSPKSTIIVADDFNARTQIGIILLPPVTVRKKGCVID